MISLVGAWAESSGVRARMRRAASSTLLMHAVSSLCTAGFALPLAASVPEQALAEQPAVGALFTAVRVFDTLTASPLRFGALPALILLLLAPFLQVLWLRAQLIAAPLHEHARSAAHAYKQAAAVYLAGSAYAALALVCALAVARSCELLLQFTHNLRIQQTTGVLLAAPLLFAALVHAPSVLDRAQLELARGERFSRQLAWEVLRAVDLRVCGVRAGLALATGSLLLLSLLPRMWLGTSSTTALWLFLLAQLAAAIRTLARGAWLAWLVEHSTTAPVTEHAAASGGAFEPQEL